ncbi:complement factor H-like [Takifugu flavidus]|uniref:complement factor H-like n=1 Tax=Takifugu flavidus TaxID=433684 RepID=UPI00254407EF|nr:complement factor H-like [Takifugu flavidus]
MGSTRVTLALLLCFAGPRDAQVEPGSCRPPRLTGGYFVPKKESYDSGAQVAYTCEEGHKPAAEGWWSTSLCQGGTWVPRPQCIDEGACLPPEITNANFPPSELGWYPHGHKIRVTCIEGYTHQNFRATAQCWNGSWSTLPVCTKHLGACDEPPRIPHAVVINWDHQEVFTEDSQVQYQCKEGYEMEGGSTDKKSICIGGKWTDVPTCTASCVLDAAHYPSSTVKLSGVQYLKEGEEREIPCIWDADPHTSLARCTRGKVTLSRCCRVYNRQWNPCRW